MLKPRRCEECRRRKKRCVLSTNSTSCDYCDKKGVECVLNDDVLQIVHYNYSDSNNNAHQRRRSSTNSTSNGSSSSTFVDGPNVSKVQAHVMKPPSKPPSAKSRRSSSVSSRTTLDSTTDVTTSSLISVINSVKILNGSAQAHDETVDPMMSCKPGGALGFINMSDIYLPRSDLLTIPNEGHGDPMINDELIRSSVPQTLKIPERLSLVDFLFSSTRIQSLEGLSDDPAKILSLALGEIKSFLDNDKQSGDIVHVLRERGYLVSTEGPHTSDEKNPQLLQRGHMLRSGTGTIPTSIHDVDLSIDTENLSIEYFVEKAGITLEDGERKFCDIIGEAAFNQVIASVLFDHFCTITPFDLKLSCAVDSPPQHSKTHPPQPKSYLAVVLPLIAGNATVLKTAILLGYHHWMKSNPEDVMSVLHEDMERLHLDVLLELKDRLTNTTSLCCDHTIICTIFLLNLELVSSGMRGVLSSKLSVLLHNLIKFRGGAEKVSTTLTGICLLRLMSSHLCTAMLSFRPESIETHEVINLNDFIYILDHKPRIQFYDMVNFKPDLCPNDMKELLRMYANVFQLHNLSGISYFANIRESSSFGDLYDSISTQNLEYAVNESERLSQCIIQSTLKLNDVDIMRVNMNNMMPQKYSIQYSFALRASLLCLYQMVFRFNSLTPKSVLVVKQLLNDAESMFAILGSLTMEECYDTSIFVMPLFILGVDIISAKRRSWYLDNLETLYSRTRKESLRTCIDLLKDVWRINVVGLAYVDWKALAQEKSVMLPFCA